MPELSGYGYLCSAGETFDLIALEVYGDEKYAAEIMNANPELVNRIVFRGGETVLLPVIETDRVSVLETLMQAPAPAPWKVV